MYQHKLQVINAEKCRYDGCFAGIKLASCNIIWELFVLQHLKSSWLCGLQVEKD